MEPLIFFLYPLISNSNKKNYHFKIIKGTENMLKSYYLKDKKKEENVFNDKNQN